MKRQRRVKAKVFIVNCERNEDYEHELKETGTSHEYHGFNFYVPMDIDVKTATDFIIKCLQTNCRPLISITADSVYRALEGNVWGLKQIEHSIKFGYHR